MNDQLKKTLLEITSEGIERGECLCCGEINELISNNILKYFPFDDNCKYCRLIKEKIKESYISTEEFFEILDECNNWDYTKKPNIYCCPQIIDICIADGNVYPNTPVHFFLTAANDCIYIKEFNKKLYNIHAIIYDEQKREFAFKCRVDHSLYSGTIVKMRLLYKWENDSFKNKIESLAYFPYSDTPLPFFLEYDNIRTVSSVCRPEYNTIFVDYINNNSNQSIATVKLKDSHDIKYNKHINEYSFKARVNNSLYSGTKIKLKKLFSYNDIINNIK